MKNATLAILIAAAASVAIMSPASAKQRYVSKAPVDAVVSVPLMLGVGY